MRTLGRLERIALSRGFTLAMTLVVLALVVALLVREILAHLGAIAGDVPVGEDLHAFAGGILIVTHGVVLEGRDIVVADMKKRVDLESPARQDAFSEMCELEGFWLLVVGLVVEVADVMFDLWDGTSTAFLVAKLVTSVLLNAVALCLLLRLTWRILRFDLHGTTEQNPL